MYVKFARVWLVHMAVAALYDLNLQYHWNVCYGIQKSLCTLILLSFFFFFEYWVLKWRYHFYCNFVSQICKNSLWERNCQWKELCIVIFCETFWFIFKYIHTIPCFLLFFFSHQYIQSWALIQTGFQQVPFSFGLKFWHLKRFV